MKEKNYAIMHIEKYKNKVSMTKSYNHNYRRLTNVPNSRDAQRSNFKNVQLDRIHLDKELVSTYEGKDYYQVFREKIAKLPYYSDHQVRANAVYGFEIMLTMSPEMVDKINIDEWSKENVTWLQQTFGIENVESAMMHLDESTPHIHAFVIPIKDGRLSAKAFIDGPGQLRKLQDDYAKAMEPLGLERGIKALHGDYQDIHRLQGKVKDELAKIDEITKVQKTKLGINESADSFAERVVPFLKQVVRRNEYLEAETDKLNSMMKNIGRKDKYYDDIKENIKNQNEIDVELQRLATLGAKIEKIMKEHPDETLRSNYGKYVKMAEVWTKNELEKEGLEREKKKNK